MEKNQPISPEELEAIEGYVQNNMMPEERAEFEKQLSADNSLQSKVSELQLLMAGVSEAVLQDKMNEFYKALPAGERLHRIGHKNSSLRTWMIAASILFIAGLGGWLLLTNQKSGENLFANYFKPDSGLITAMSAGPNNYSFEKAMIDYKRGDYTTAIGEWSSLQKTQPDNDTLNYFLGVAHLANNDAAKAINYLERVTAERQSFFRDDAFWYAGLAQLKEGKKAEAILLIEQSSHTNKEALLKKLKK